MTLIGITDDGVRIHAWLEEDKVQISGEYDDGTPVAIESFSITRRIDLDLPPGEYPADLVTWKSPERAA